MMIGEKSKTVAFLPPPGRQGKKWSKRRDCRKKPVQASQKAETTPEPITSPLWQCSPLGLWLVDSHRASGPCPPYPRPCAPGHQHSRNAGVALLTRVELGWAGQSPGGGQRGLRTQRAGQVGRCSTWTGGRTDRHIRACP